MQAQIIGCKLRGKNIFGINQKKSKRNDKRYRRKHQNTPLF